MDRVLKISMIIELCSQFVYTDDFKSNHSREGVRAIEVFRAIGRTHLINGKSLNQFART